MPNVDLLTADMQAAASSAAPSVGRLQATETALLICDVQERFRNIIAGFPAVVDTARRLARGAEALEIPVIATEQYPKALGSTVEELKQVLPESAFIQDKNHFTMCGESCRLCSLRLPLLSLTESCNPKTPVLQLTL